MSKKSFAAAINEALRGEMRHDPSVVLMGEDIAGGMGCEGEQDAWGGSWAVTKGLLGEFGRARVIDTPISEAGYLGLAAGASNCGLRVVAEIMFADFLGVCFDQLLNNISKFSYMYDGQVRTPITIRTSFGAGVGGAAQHSQALYAMVAGIPGLKVVVPSCAADAKGLLAAAIRDDDPVVFFENVRLYRRKEEVPDEPYLLPIGKGRTVMDGADVTIVAVGAMVDVASRAAKLLSAEGIECCLIDPRTIAPLDIDLIFDSVRRTGRLVIVDEGTPRMGFASEVSSLVAAEMFGTMRAPVRCVTAADTPVPFAHPLELAYLPDVDRVVEAVRATLGDR